MEFKKNDWEGVALIPFIDAHLLVHEHNQVNTVALTPDEKKRNSRGVQRIFTYDADVEDTIPSPMPGRLPELTHCQTRCGVYISPEFPMDTGGRFMPVLCEGVDTGPNATAGFPSLFTRPILHDIRNAKVNCFGRPSTRDSVVLCVTGKDEGLPTTADAVKDIVGKRYFAGWPYLSECVVKSVSDKTCRIFMREGKVNSSAHSPEQSDKWVKDGKMEREGLLTKKGIDVGDIHVVIEVVTLSGMIRTARGDSMKQFEGQTVRFPLQLAAENPSQKDARHEEKGAAAIQDDFPIGSEVLVMQKPLTGTLAKVVGHVSDRLIEVEMELTPKVRPEQDFFGQRVASSGATLLFQFFLPQTPLLNFLCLFS